MLRCAERIEQLHRHGAADDGVSAGHRDEWDYTGTTGDQLDWLGLIRPPHEPSAEWTAELDGVTEFEVVDEEGGDLTVWQPFDAQFDLLTGAGSGKGVRADSLIPVRRGESDIHVLPGIVAWPARHGEGDAPRVGGQSVGTREPAGEPANGWADHA